MPNPIVFHPAIRQNRHSGLPAVNRLLRLAQSDTGQARRIADFLLSWHNAAENGGWNPADLWTVDDAIADDMMTVLRLIRDLHVYPDQLGLGQEFQALWLHWRSPAQSHG